MEILFRFKDIIKFRVSWYLVDWIVVLWVYNFIVLIFSLVEINLKINIFICRVYFFLYLYCGVEYIVNVWLLILLFNGICLVLVKCDYWDVDF